MEDKLILELLTGIAGRLDALHDKVDGMRGSLNDSVERMEDVMDKVEGERRVDAYGLNDD